MTKIFDDQGMEVGRIQDGAVLDRKGRRKAHVSGDFLFDDRGFRIGGITDGNIFDDFGFRRGVFERGLIIDDRGFRVGSVDGPEAPVGAAGLVLLLSTVE